MPSFAFNGMLIYFAAHTNHLGFYPFTSAIRAFSMDLAPYHKTKGGIQFPYSSPLPLNLIKRNGGIQGSGKSPESSIKESP